MLDYTVNIGLFSLASAGYITFFFPQLKTTNIVLNILGLNVNVHAIGILAFFLVLGLILLNMLGIRESSFLNELLVAVSVSVQVLILAAGFALAFSIALLWTQLDIVGSATRFLTIQYLFALPVSTQNFMYGVTIAMTSFIGIESIAQAAEETRRPWKWIPRANKLSIIAVMGFSFGFSMLSIGIMPWEQIAASATDPIAVLAGRIPLIGSILAVIVAITGAVICYVSTNTGVIGVSRVAFSMGRFKLLPAWFYRVHPRYRTPTRTIIIFGLLGAAMALVGELTFVADLYAFGALLSYFIVNLCLIVLRNKDPDAFRPWKIPGSFSLNIGRRRVVVPALSVVGVIACAVIWSLILSFHEGGRILGVAWVLIGFAGYALYRRRTGTPIVNSGISREIVPGGYSMKAVVLVRTPESEETIVDSIRSSLDKRFRLTLLNIIDPHELGLRQDEIRSYRLLKQEEIRATRELSLIAGRLRREGYQCDARVEVGPTARAIEAEATSVENDALVLIKRRTLKGHVIKDRADSLFAVASKYPGKIMVVRRISQSA
jgi:APA family basic amino acid/polyamine antiporter